MTTTARTWMPADQDDGFRARVRDTLNGFTVGDVASWEQARHLPMTAVAEFARRGIFRARWEPGAEGGLPLLITLSQETSQVSGGLAVAVMGHSEMFVGALTWLATSPGQLALREDALDGRVVGCFAATETQGGSDLAGIRSTATPASGGWRLRGCKRYVSNIGGASHVLVLARPEGARDARDLGLFVVPLDNPGMTVDGYFHAVGIAACDVGQVSFDTTVPADAVLGRPALGLLYATHLLNFERISICAQLLAMAELSVRLAVAYARRRAVGGMRVFDRQAVRHRLAGCQAELWTLQGRLAEIVARVERLRRMPAHEIAAFKLTSAEAAGQIVDTCMQVFGARGGMGNFPVERLWRDTRMARMGGGTDEVLADMVASGLDRDDPAIDALLDEYMAGDTPRPADG